MKKFRVWSKKENKFVGNEEMQLQIDDKGRCYMAVRLTLEEEGAMSDDDFVIQQFTGLKDKNGIEIFEGDILEFGYEGCEKKTLVVEFNTKDIGSCGCCYDMFFGSGFIIKGTMGNPDEGIEIIGNIFENPELLKSKQNG